MNGRLDIDRALAAWLADEAPARAPAHLLDTARERIRMTTQSRPWWPPRISGVPRDLKLAIATAAVVVLVLAMTVIPRGDLRVGSPTSPPTPTVGSSPSPSSNESSLGADFGRLPQGEHDIGWPGGPPDARIRVTIPTAEWSWMGVSRYVVNADNGRLYGFPAEMSTHTVSQVVTSVCALDEGSGEVGPIFEDVGPTVDDLVAAIAKVGGTSWSDPVEVSIGGHRGKRLVTTYVPHCAGPSRRTIWEGSTGYFFVEAGMRSTIDILDVAGDRLVLTTNLRTDRPTVARELDDIVSSIAIVRDRPPIAHPTLVPSFGSGRPFPHAVGPDADLRVGRHRASVEGIPFTFDVPDPGWETQLGFYLVKSITGPQGAEGTIRWTTIPNGEYTDPCPDVLDDSPGRSVRELAAAVASAPGVRILEGPIEVTVGGQPAAFVALEVERDLGCDPGYFYTYDAPDGGALWLTTKAGDRISVWIVEVDGKILFIETEAIVSAQPILEASFRQMVDSMEFE